MAPPSLSSFYATSQPQRRDDVLYDLKGGSLRSPPFAELRAAAGGRPRPAPTDPNARALKRRGPRACGPRRPRVSVVDADAASTTPLGRSDAQRGALTQADGLADQHRGKQGQQWTWPSPARPAPASSLA
jgi:hypothetical protein